MRCNLTLVFLCLLSFVGDVCNSTAFAQDEEDDAKVAAIKKETETLLKDFETQLEKAMEQADTEKLQKLMGEISFQKDLAIKIAKLHHKVSKQHWKKVEGITNITWRNFISEASKAPSTSLYTDASLSHALRGYALEMRAIRLGKILDRVQGLYQSEIRREQRLANTTAGSDVSKAITVTTSDGKPLTGATLTLIPKTRDGETTTHKVDIAGRVILPIDKIAGSQVVVSSKEITDVKTSGTGLLSNGEIEGHTVVVTGKYKKPDIDPYELAVLIGDLDLSALGLDPPLKEIEIVDVEEFEVKGGKVFRIEAVEVPGKANPVDPKEKDSLPLVVSDGTKKPDAKKIESAIKDRVKKDKIPVSDVTVEVKNPQSPKRIATKAAVLKDDKWTEDDEKKFQEQMHENSWEGSTETLNFEEEGEVVLLNVEPVDEWAVKPESIESVLRRIFPDVEVHIRIGPEVEIPNDPHFDATGSWGQEYSDQWAMHRVGMKGDANGDWPFSWLKEDAAVHPNVVAVVGSGVDYEHPDLKQKMWHNPNEIPGNGVDDDENGYVDDFYGWNFRDSSSDVMDYGGHDTHVAGVIAAQWHNETGIAGVNPAAFIMPLKVANMMGQGDTIAVGEAIVYAVKNGAKVINISYSADQQSKFVEKAIAFAESKDVLVVVSSGNQGVDTAERGIAGTPGAFVVAGSTVDDKRVSFSNWGKNVSITAPSMDILSLRAGSSDFLLYFGQNPDYVAGQAIVGEDKSLYRAGGTSFSAPFVAGAASLIWSTDPSLTVQQVRNKLLMGARDIDVPGWDQNTGAGLLNIPRAVKSDPNHYLFTQITGVKPVEASGQITVNVEGRAIGSKFSGRWLQVAFGESPAKDDWKTVSYSGEQVDAGVLGSIPVSSFDRRGQWSIRLLVQDKDKTVRQARGTLNLN